MAQRGSMPRTGASSMATRPVLATSSPAAMRSRVDLPQPLAPRIATTSPAAMSRSRSRRMTASPVPSGLGKVLRSPSKDTRWAVATVVGAGWIGRGVGVGAGWSIVGIGTPGERASWSARGGHEKAAVRVVDCGPLGSGRSDRRQQVIVRDRSPGIPSWGRQGIHIAVRRAVDIGSSIAESTANVQYSGRSFRTETETQPRGDQLSGSVHRVGPPGVSWLPRKAKSSKAAMSSLFPRIPMYTCEPGRVAR